MLRAQFFKMGGGKIKRLFLFWHNFESPHLKFKLLKKDNILLLRFCIQQIYLQIMFDKLSKWFSRLFVLSTDTLVLLETLSLSLWCYDYWIAHIE